MFNVDDLRLVEGTNTQVRQLRIVSVLIATIGKSHLPIDILRSRMLKWSLSLEKVNPGYSGANGKLTESGKPTTAFPKYVELSESLGLISKVGQTLILTRFGILLKHFVDKSEIKDFRLSLYERAFYLYLLISKDADYILTIIHLIKTCENFIHQNEAQKQFEENFINRLKLKISYATSQAKSTIAEKKRIVQYEWRNTKKYSEHIIGPRLEWLNSLGLISMEKFGSKTIYIFTDVGISFFNEFPKDSKLGIIDINRTWLDKNFLHSIRFLVSKNTISNDKEILLQRYLLKAADLFGASNAFRIPIEVTFLFTSLSILIIHHKIIEFNEIKEALNSGIEVDGKLFGFKSAARTTEGYITIKLI